VRLETEGSVVQAHRMLGVAHLFENRPDDARREFRKLLELRPDYRFDPLLDPPRVVELFNDVVKEEENEIASVEAKRKKREGERAQRRREEAERVCRAIAPVVRYQKHSFAINFLPLGAGQFQNGQRRKGWLFFGTEAVLGAVSVATFSSNFILFGFTPKRNCLDPPSANPNGRCMNIDHSQEDLSNQLLRVQLVSGALFAAVAFLGVVDAIRNFTDEVQVSPPPASGPAAPAAGPEAAAPAPAAARRKVTSMPAALLPTPFPLVEGTSTGLGFKWRF
jgi:hypothetical protein